MALGELPVRSSSVREGGTVVIVDPDSAHAAAMADAVRALGHAVTITATAAEALASIEREAPDILVLAVTLPDMGGPELARRASLLSTPPDVVLVAERATPEAGLVALEVEAAGVLVKPVNAARAGGLIGRLVERHRRRHEQQEFTEKLRTLSALSGLITSARDTQEVFKALARAATMLLGARLVHVWVDDPRAQVLRVRGTYGLDPEFERPLTEYEVISYGSGMAGGTFTAGRPEFIFGVRTSPRWKNRRLAEAAGLHAYAGLPLMAGDRTLGVLAIVFGERGEFSVEEKELMQRLADHAAFTIVRSEAREQAERDRARLEVLYAVSRRLASVHDVDGVLNVVVNEAARLLGLEAAGIRLLEGEDLVISARTEAAAQLMTRPTLRVGESLSGRVVASGQPLIVEDIEQETVQDPEQRQAALRVGYHAYLGVPLKVGGRAVGVLSVWGRAARSFAPDDVALLSAFADQAAVAFEEARLYAETREREREATNLARVTAHLASSLQLDRVLDLITWSAKELLRCDAAAVWRYDEGRDGLVAYRASGMPIERISHVVVKPGQGLAGRVLKERKPLWTRQLTRSLQDDAPDASETATALGLQAALAAPIVSGEEAYGVLVVYRRAADDFALREVTLLSTLADHAAIAVRNARLYSETRQREDENAQLYAEASTQRERLGRIFDSTSDGIMFVTQEGRIEAINRQAGDLLGTDSDAMIGGDLLDLLEDRIAEAGAEDGLPLSLRTLFSHTEGGEGDLALPRLKRVLRWVAQPTTEGGGRAVGLTITFQDVTRDREVNQMKTDFVSFVTHQLRTPLSGIKWMLELVADAEIPIDIRSYVADARDASERLINLVNDLLDISRLERGRLEIRPQPTDLGALTASVLEEVAGLVRTHDHRISVTGVDDAPTVIADPQLLRQVVLNLISNAIKYTPRSGEIAIRISGVGDRVRWEIQDNGIGIPRDAQRRLFEKFYRADNVFAVETEGTGLGLYLVRLIIEQFGGRVWCDSEEGRGATFVFTLPNSGVA